MVQAYLVFSLAPVVGMNSGGPVNLALNVAVIIGLLWSPFAAGPEGLGSFRRSVDRGLRPLGVRGVVPLPCDAVRGHLLQLATRGLALRPCATAHTRHLRTGHARLATASAAGAPSDRC